MPNTMYQYQKYTEDQLVVVGHYWRRFAPDSKWDEAVKGFEPSGKDPFDRADGDDFAAHGGGGGVMCVDYSVGIRYEERGKGWAPGAMGTGLAALRLPERVLIFDDGRKELVTNN